MSALRILFALALPALVAACPSGATGDDAGKASLVVGVQSDDFGGLVETVHIVATVDGKPASDQTLRVGPTNPTALPKEVLLEGAAGARVEVTVEATTTQAATKGQSTPVVVRRASAQLVPDVKKLLRMQLEGRCVTFSAPGSSLPPAPTCNAPQTCSAGRCSGAHARAHRR